MKKNIADGKERLRMKKKIANNLGLKILALVTSIVLWLIIINVDDPVKMEEFNNVEVTLLNTDIVTNNDKIYEVLDKTNFITVKVYARRSVLDTLDVSNIRAYADLADLEDTIKIAGTGGTAYLDNLKISVSTNKYNSELESINTSADYVKVSIEDLKKLQKAITVEVRGEPAEGYVIGDYSTRSNLVKISGPASEVNRIASAKVIADVNGFAGTITWDADIRLYDVDGKEIKSKNLTMSLDKVSTTVEILQTKEVPIVLNTSGTPADGYAMNGVLISDPSRILIAGETDVISTVSKITVPASAIDVTDRDENYELGISLSNYLPAGVRIIDENYTGKIQVTVGIEKKRSVNIWKSVGDIVVTGLPEGCQYSITDPSASLMITVNGLQGDLSALNRDEIIILANMSGFVSDGVINEGTYSVPVTISVPTGISVEGNYAVNVQVTTDSSDTPVEE